MGLKRSLSPGGDQGENKRLRVGSSPFQESQLTIPHSSTSPTSPHPCTPYKPTIVSTPTDSPVYSPLYSLPSNPLSPQVLITPPCSGFGTEDHEEEDDFYETSVLPRISWDHLTRGEPLGSGVFGITYLGTLRRCPGEELQVAIKIPRSHKRSSGVDTDREAQILQELEGAGGAPIFLGMAVRPLAIVMQYCPGITLGQFMSISPLEVRQTAVGKVSQALSDFHAKGYAHRDFHANNIMIHDHNGEYDVHIIDVGLAEKMTPQNRDALLDKDAEHMNFFAYCWARDAPSPAFRPSCEKI